MTTVWVVMKNADMTEGRGPMLFHSVWDDENAVVAWVSAQDGAYGSVVSRVDQTGTTYYVANGYRIDRVRLHTKENVASLTGLRDERKRLRKEAAAITVRLEEIDGLMRGE